MGRITSLFAQKVAGQVQSAGGSDALLRMLGLEEGQDVDPSFMIKAEDYYLFFERAAAAEGDATTESEPVCGECFAGDG